MSDVTLNMTLQIMAERIVKELITEYNNPSLTLEGKRKTLDEKIFFTLLEGVKLGKFMSEKEIKSLKDKINLYEWDKYPERMGQ